MQYIKLEIYNRKASLTQKHSFCFRFFLPMSMTFPSDLTNLIWQGLSLPSPFVFPCLTFMNYELGGCVEQWRGALSPGHWASMVRAASYHSLKQLTFQIGNKESPSPSRTIKPCLSQGWMHCNTDNYFSATAAAAALSRMRETESKGHSLQQRKSA